jgi:DNA invertase Pin-like site-specific DNA recombinase
MLVGYARVSTLEQNVSLQIDALKKVGCQRIFRDKVRGAKAERPGLHEAIEFHREGDSLVVWRLDRLGRSLKHLLETVGTLEKHGIGLRNLEESIDTTTSGDRLILPSLRRPGRVWTERNGRAYYR